MPSNELTAHRPSVKAYHERNQNSWLRVASVYRCATEECDIPPLDIRVQAIPALAISLRRCRATTYTSSVVPRFTDMLLSPFPFGSRLVVRLRVLCPELRPTLLAIHSVRDTAHGFPSYGSPTTFFPWHAQLVLSPLFRFATSNQVRQSPLPRLDLHQLADDSFAGHTNGLLCAVLRNYPLFRSPPTHQE